MDGYKIIIEDISKIKPNPKNPNQHDESQIDRLCKLITAHGFRVPIIVSRQSGFIAAGHGRLEASKKLGLKTVPVMYQDFDSPEIEYQFMIADNAISGWSELDLSKINIDIGEFGPFDIELLGLRNFQVEPFDLEKLDNQNEIKKYILEVEFPTSDEMNKVFEDLTERGFMVKVK
jgi:hypothetical protein